MPALPLVAAAFTGGTLASATLGDPWWLSVLATGVLAASLLATGAVRGRRPGCSR